MTAPISSHVRRADPGAGWRVDPLTEADLDELYPILADPEVYAHGYVMHRRPVSRADARALGRSVFLPKQGQADGQGGGRVAYAIQLTTSSHLGPAGALVGTSAMAEADVHNESIHLGGGSPAAPHQT